ncbi:MAG: phage terminase large subunit [Bacteroidales bacterium]
MYEPIDEFTDDFLAGLMIQNYGDLLKVSRTRGVNHTLPGLRDYISKNPYILHTYRVAIEAEKEGQGLSSNAVLNSLISAQMTAFEMKDHRNTRMYAEEIKKLITEGIKTETVAAAVQKALNPTQSLVDEIINNPLKVDIDAITTEDANAVREIFLNPIDGFERFSLWCFELQMSFKFQKQDFHSVIFEFCQSIVNGLIDRGIVCIPPRHSKTQVLSIFLPLYSFCHNPSSHNIITSYADDVVAESSGYIRQIMLEPLFKKIFPYVCIDPNKRSLERWGTTRSGVMHAVPTGGKMTGKGAGSLSTIYSGLFVVDDAIKPKDAYSNQIRQEINDRYDNTFMSRLANDGVVDDDDGNSVKCARTPMVIIMQRVHDEDLVGFLLRGGSSDKYVYLNIPGIITPECGSESWYKLISSKQAYTHAIPYLYDLKRGEGESALWPSRKSLTSLQAMRKATPYTFNSQYMGEPTAKGIGLVKEEWWNEWTELPKGEITKTFMTADTASTSKDYSDYSVICLWHLARDQRLYLGDVTLGKWETPELKENIEKFWIKHTAFDMRYPSLLPTALYLEDKSSGQFLNQQYQKDGSVRVLPVPKDRTSGDKVARFLNAVPYWAQGRFVMPAEHKHKDHIMREILGMTGQGSGTGHDDVVDNVSDAAVVAFSASSANYQDWV